MGDTRPRILTTKSSHIVEDGRRQVGFVRCSIQGPVCSKHVSKTQHHSGLVVCTPVSVKAALVLFQGEGVV
jgi:hypothetical protein